MGSMKTGRSFILSFLGLIFSVTPIFANQYPTHRRNPEASTGELWIPPNVQESWTSMENVSQVTTHDPDPSPAGVPLKNAKQKIADGSGRLKRHIVDPETDPLFALPETDPMDSLTLLREQLQSRSCEAEASKFNHDREIGAMALTARGIFCEADKLLRYAWIAVQNLKYEFGLDKLFDAGTQRKRLKRLLSDKSPFEAVEYYLTRFQRFLTNPEYLEYLSIAVQNSVPMAEIRETLDRLEIAIENLVDRVEELVASRLDLHIGTDAATQLREELVDAKGEASRFVREHLSNHIEGNQLQRTVSFVEWLFDRFLESESFYRYFPALKGVADASRDFYRGFDASGFQESIIAPVRNLISTSLADVREIPSANRILRDGRRLFASILHPISTALGESLSSIPYDISSRVARRSFEPEHSSSSPESMIFPPLSIFVGDSSSATASVESSSSPTTIPTRTSISDHVPGTSATYTANALVMAVATTAEETEETSPLSVVPPSSSNTSYAASSPLLRRSQTPFSPSLLSIKSETEGLPFPAVYRRLQTTSRERP